MAESSLSLRTRSWPVPSLKRSQTVQRLPPAADNLSCSHEHGGFTGTVSISATTLFQVIRDVQASLEQQGIRQLVLVSGHGGNYVLGNVVQEANVAGRPMALFPQRDDWDQPASLAGWSRTTTRTCTGESSRRPSC